MVTPSTEFSYASTLAENHSTGVRNLLVPIGGGVAFLTVFLVVLGIFALTYCPRRKGRRIAEEPWENQPIPNTPRAPGARRGFTSE